MDTSLHIKQLRTQYSLFQLNESEVDQDPFVQLEKWIKQALQAEANWPNAMVLTTVSNDGRPSSRVVLLKDFGQDGLIFFTNYSSRKGKELDSNPYVCLTFFWPELERQVRIEGMAKRISEEESSNYFKTRPVESQIGAWASNQSAQLHSRVELEDRMAHFTQLFSDKEVPKPHHWGGYQVFPSYFEFWQGRANRLHDRIAFTKLPENWMITRLSP
ncbi:MAG: pyridoxamine 5'-phosphate oxidase [Bacteroidia bacterium]|nr:pyridoxamine 5'-phosphate oxidase [Bacteroidia bacterium]